MSPMLPVRSVLRAARSPLSYAVVLTVVASAATAVAAPSPTGSLQRDDADGASVRSAPLDGRPYNRSLVAGERGSGALQRKGKVVAGAQQAPVQGVATQTPSVYLFDTIVSNVDATLATSDTFNDGETSIAINPANPDEILVTAFSGGWGNGGNAAIFHSTNGGNLWTKRFTFPRPPGSPVGCPCDQTIDYGRGNRWSAVVLNTDLYTGTGTNPAQANTFGWPLNGMGNAIRTNLNNMPDQPWLLVNRDPGNAAQDNVFVGYDDFSTSPVDMRVAVAQGTNPPTVTFDRLTGASTGGNINPGHRLASDPRNGTMYSLFQQRTATNGDVKSINYRLNRSTDGGNTWTLNGSATGITVANADSVQPTPKFGGVNALLGGIDHAAVNPNNGDVYYAYGDRDAQGNNRISLRRLTDNGAGGLNIGAALDVTGAVDAALPSVAVAADNSIGVMYYTFDGADPSGFPRFSVRLAVSLDNGQTWGRQTLSTFLSPATNNTADNRQRVYGDYHQIKAVGNDFVGAFTGNGAAFGRTTSNNDPIFFTTRKPADPSLSISDATVNEGDAGKTNANFTLTLDRPDSRAITATVSTANATATAPSDFDAVNTNVTFAAGETQKTVSVAVNGDLVDELDETFAVNVSGLPSFVTVTDGSAVGKIIDDDEAKLSIADVSVTEGQSGTTPAVFIVTSSNPADRPITVNFATSDGTATTPDDYAQTGGTLTFVPGDQQESATVPVVGDTIDELAETFMVTLSGPVVATIADGTAIGTIIDDDRDGLFTCRGTALRAGGSEAVVANPPDVPCADDARNLLRARATSGLISAAADVASASTDQTPNVLAGTTPAVGDSAVTNAAASGVSIISGPNIITVSSLSAQAQARCTGSGPPALTGSSNVALLKVNSQPLLSTSQPVTIPLLSATLRLNERTVSGGQVVQRALVLDNAIGPDIVIGEAKAGFKGTPVHPAGHPCVA